MAAAHAGRQGGNPGAEDGRGHGRLNLGAPSASVAPQSHAQGSGAAGQTPAAASLALLTRGGKNGKVPGKSGLPAALELSGAKTNRIFLDLVSARSGMKDKAAAQAAALMQKALAAAKTGAAAVAGAVPSGSDAQAAGTAKAAAHDEKTPAKKRAPAAPGPSAAGIALLALAPSDGHSQPALRRPGSAEPKAAAAATHGAERGTQPVVHVVDLRTKVKPGTGTEQADASKSRAAPGSTETDAGTGASQRLVSFRDAPTTGSRASASSGGSAAAAQTPLERLREMAGSELLKATNLVLKDGGGEIRLVLKPESLGSVRIRMNVVDNAIEGKIIVDSSTVKAVFDANIDALRRALTAEGFQTGSLQVSVGGQNTDADARREQQPSEPVRRTVAQGFERNVPGVETMNLGDLLVNLFV